MNYCTIKETASRWGVSEQLVRRYCRQGRITDLMQQDGVWMIPEDCTKPKDGRAKEPEQVMLPPIPGNTLGDTPEDSRINQRRHAGSGKNR